MNQLLIADTVLPVTISRRNSSKDPRPIRAEQADEVWACESVTLLSGPHFMGEIDRSGNHVISEGRVTLNNATALT